LQGGIKIRDLHVNPLGSEGVKYNIIVIHLVETKCSQTSFIRTSKKQNPTIQRKTGRDGFFPMHFIPLIWKYRCLIPTRKFRNGYVKSVEKKLLNWIMPTVI